MLATAATRRSSEQQPQDSIHRPSTSNSFRSPKASHNSRNTTPSISPLSNASKSHNDSAVHSTALDPDPTNGRAGIHDDNEDEPLQRAIRIRRDTSSSLSDVEGSFGEQDQEQSGSEDGATIDDEANDSEAETERVQPTPLKSGGQSNEIGSRTPLEILKGDLVSDSDSLRANEGHGLRKKLIGLADRKRKRGLAHAESATDFSDESDSDGTLLKQEAGAGGSEIGEKDVPNTNGVAEAGHAVDASDIGVLSIESKQTKNKNQKRSHKKRIPVVEPEVPNNEVEEHDEAGDDSADTMSPEDAAKHEEATNRFGRVAEQFFALRSALQSEKIADAESELAQLHQSHPMHTEYIRQLQAVTERRDIKIRQETKLHEFKKQALQNSILASRSQLLSQYLQDVREIRERTLYELGKQWYDIQKERRQSDELERYVIRFPTRRSQQVEQQAKYNTEVSVLSGFAKYVGFPAAPDVAASKPDDVDSDLKAMKIAKGHAPTTYYGPSYNPPPAATPAIPQSERNAQREFLEKTPWANPHHPVHSQSRSPSTFGQQGLNPNPTPPYSLMGRVPSFTTPYGGHDHQSEQRHPGSNDTVGMPSDPASSVLAAPPTTDRIRLLPYEQGDTSPTAHVKRATAGKRDFSGLSSTSTIDVPQDGDTRPPMDQPLPQQVFATSSLHAQHSH